MTTISPGSTVVIIEAVDGFTFANEIEMAMSRGNLVIKHISSGSQGYKAVLIKVGENV